MVPSVQCWAEPQAPGPRPQAPDSILGDRTCAHRIGPYWIKPQTPRFALVNCLQTHRICFCGTCPGSLDFSCSFRPRPLSVCTDPDVFNCLCLCAIQPACQGCVFVCVCVCVCVLCIGVCVCVFVLCIGAWVRSGM